MAIERKAPSINDPDMARLTAATKRPIAAMKRSIAAMELVSAAVSGLALVVERHTTEINKFRGHE